VEESDEVGAAGQGTTEQPGTAELVVEALVNRQVGRRQAEGPQLPHEVVAGADGEYATGTWEGVEGAVDDLIRPGLERQDPACPHFGLCGGCRWQDIAYEDQMQLKQDMILGAFAEGCSRVEDIARRIGLPADSVRRSLLRMQDNHLLDRITTG